MTGAIESRTANYNLRRINFDWTTWHDEMNDNMSDLDAVIAALTGITGVEVWANSTAYVVGNKRIDTVSNVIYITAINHTSAASPTTFAADRVAHPTYWTAFGAPPTAATWTTATAYRQGTWITDDDNRTAVALVDFTSGATMDDDIADDYLLVIADFNGLSGAVADATAAAISTAADAVATAADRVAVAADTATVAANTATVANNTSITTANASSALASASAAAVSASDAATLYDNFDDRYLGAKAADPTLDNDGNALITGALYFNTVSAVMRVRNASAAWQTVAAAGTLSTGDIGVTVQAYDALLLAIAALTTVADRMPYFNGTDTVAMTTLTSFMRTLLDDTDAATARSTLGVAAATAFYDFVDQASNTTATVNTANRCTSNITLTLPASMTVGQWITVMADTTAGNVVVARNSQNLASLAEDFTINVGAHNKSVFLFYCYSSGNVRIFNLGEMA